MAFRGFGLGIAVSGIVLSVLVGCGGSSYNPPAPIVMFTSPMAGSSINLGGTAQVAWTSSNATSCAASTSDSAGGVFTGSQKINDTQTVVPTATGTHLYTLSCSGAGGTASASASVMVAANLLTVMTPTGAISTVGPTVDPTNGDQNPYGLVIAPVSAGLITKGDLIVCNFNNAANTQGAGTTIIGLHPGTGSKPYHIAQSPDLLACNALAMLPDDSIAAASWNQSPNPNPLVTATGTVGAPFASDVFNDPWGEAFVPATAMQPATLYVSNAPDNNGVIGGTPTTPAAPGTVDRITLDANNAQTSFTEIVTGFCTGGAPGVIFGPSGLTYDPASDTLYVIDTSSNSVIALTGVSSIQKDGVVVNGQCSAATPTPEPTFSGPSMASAKVIAHGSPLSAPISAALLKNGDLVVGNGDIAAPGGALPASKTTNELIEVSPWVPGAFVGTPLQIDSGNSGAIFGIAATTDAQGKQLIYFNDDNSSTVMSLIE
jgi:hypothetical protein